MATVAIHIDDDGSYAPDREHGKRSCFDKLRVLITIYAGNGAPTSKMARAWQWIARVLIVLNGPLQATGNIMYPCWGTLKERGESCLFINMCVHIAHLRSSALHFLLS